MADVLPKRLSSVLRNLYRNGIGNTINYYSCSLKIEGMIRKINTGMFCIVTAQIGL